MNTTFEKTEKSTDDEMKKFICKDIGRFSFYQNFTDFGFHIGISGEPNLFNKPILGLQIGFWSIEIWLSKIK